MNSLYKAIVSYRGLGANKSFFSKKEHRADGRKEKK